MPRIPGTSHAQTIFLRAFRTHPAGPPKELWPAPSILRKWLRKPAFHRALQSVQDALRFQADFHLANAATQAAQKLSADSLSNLDLNRLLRLSHLRQRFNISSAETEPANNQSDNDNVDDENEPEPESEYDENGTWLNPYQRALRRILPDALRLDFLPPINRYPDFPEPVPQDTYYYKLLHHPSTLLWYMKLYTDRFKQDARFQRILELCENIVPHEWPAGPFPHFPKPTTDNQQLTTGN